MRSFKALIMKSAPLLLLVILPTTAPAADLWRTWKNPKPDAIKLVKNFYETKEVASTCYEEQCSTVDGDCERMECYDRTVTNQVCETQQDCHTDQDGNNVCESHDVCHDETQVIPNDDCWHVHYSCDQTVCNQVGHACTETKEVLVRTWKATLKTNFDPKAVPAKNRDEKFTITLDGDEHDPKLAIKKVVGPFEYVIAPKFSADAKEVNVDFTLAPAKP